METFNIFSAIVVAIFLEAMPFLALGALLSALIEVFVSTERLLQFIPKRTGAGIALGVAAGLVLPTCECGVVPVVRRLMNKGVPPFIAVTYMLTAPIINPIVLVSTYIAFRGSISMLLGRVVMAALVAVAVGLITKRFSSQPITHQGTTITDHDHSASHLKLSRGAKVRAVMVHAAHEFFDMGKYLVLGAVVAGLFKTLIPPSITSVFSGSILLSIVGMMLLAMVLSICSEADAFVAASFLSFPAASQLAFVTIGPMVDLKLIGMYAATFKRKMFVTLLVVPTVLVFILSWLYGLLF